MSFIMCVMSFIMCVMSFIMCVMSWATLWLWSQMSISGYRVFEKKFLQFLFYCWEKWLRKAALPRSYPGDKIINLFASQALEIETHLTHFGTKSRMFTLPAMVETLSYIDFPNLVSPSTSIKTKAEFSPSHQPPPICRKMLIVAIPINIVLFLARATEGTSLNV